MAEILELLLVDFLADEKVVSKYYRPSDNRWDLQKKYCSCDEERKQRFFVCTCCYIKTITGESASV